MMRKVHGSPIPSQQEPTRTAHVASGHRPLNTSLPALVWTTLSLFIVLFTIAAPAESKERKLSFSETYAAYEKLTGDSKGTREQWSRVIRSFLVIHQAEKLSPKGNRSLFLAGRASLELYRWSGRKEDLDQAIGHLNQFVSLNRHGPHLILGLQELKEADLLKRKIDTLHARQSVVSPPERSRDVPASDFVLNNPPRVLQPSVMRPSTPQASNDPRTFPSGYNLCGNPFYMKPGASPPRDDTRMRTAAIAPRSVNDGSLVRAAEKTPVKKFVVVLDPGHGGKDPGAVSSNGLLKEKDVTLRIANHIKAKLNEKLPDVTIELTRTDDTFVPVQERTALANSLNADLFISVHCNAAEDASSKGVETYYLSKACSRKAMAVASRENGIPLGKMDEIDTGLVDLMSASKRTESVRLALSVHSALIRNLKGKTSLRQDRGVRRAPFYVLLGAKMPSVLVECGFINGKDEPKLKEPDYLDAIAQGIMQGTQNYVKSLRKRG